MSDDHIFGFLNIDKPLYVSSHDIVDRVRRQLRVRKVGHAGTLDPLASGVLVICLGAATRLSEYVMHATKRYVAHVQFGLTTTTDDAEGDIIETRDPGGLARELIEAALPRLSGDILQIPPMYSAIKVGGRKLYELARAGETVELKPRLVHIHAIHLRDWQPPVATLDVTCSSGTYVRSIARDLGAFLGTGAHLSGLRRTQSGNFQIEHARTWESLTSEPDWRRAIIPVDSALAGWRIVRLDAHQATTVGHGGAIPHEEAGERELALAYTPNGSLLAVVRAEDGFWVPQKVFWKDQDLASGG